MTTTDNNVVDSAVLLSFTNSLVAIRGQGRFTFNDEALSNIILEGTFEAIYENEAIEGSSNTLNKSTIFFDGRLTVSYGVGELEFYSKGLIYSQFEVPADPESVDLKSFIDNNQHAIKLSIQGGFDLPGVIAFDGGFEFTANTSGQTFTFQVAEDFQPLLGYSTVEIGVKSGFLLESIGGSLTLIDTFSIDGGVKISAGTGSGLNLAVDGNIGLLGLGTMSASGDIALNDSGIKTNLSLVGQAKILNLITIGGDFNLSLDATGSVPSIKLNVANPNIQFWSLFTLSPGGSVTLTFDNGIFALQDLTVGVDLSLVESEVTVDYIKSNGDLKFSFDVGGGFDQSLGIFSVGASAKATLKVQHSNGEFDIDADMSVSASISSKAVTAKIFGKTITIIPSFSKSGTISGGLDLSLDPSDGELSIGANIFGKVDISIPIGFKLPLPDAPPPNVAAISGSTVTVHVGNKSSLRSYDKEDVNETVRIRQDGSKLIVDVQGKITKLDVGSGDYTINLDAGNGLDKVIVDSSVKGKINITNTESVKYSGSGLAIITGTSGNDSISIYGNGTAVINSGAGNDNVTIDSSGRTTIDLGIGNDVISLTGTGTGSHTLTPGTGDDRIHTAIVGGSLQLILAEGFGNDILSGNGTLSRLDMSQLTSDINLEYDYQNSKLLMNSEGGNLTLESGNTPQIDRIDFGSGNDTYVIVSAFDMTLTENGGDNAFYYVESAGGTANFSGNQFSLNGRTITYDHNISQFVLGNMDYSLVKEGGAFKGTVSYRLASGSETLTLRNSGGTYALPEARVEIFSNSVHFSSNFSALSWAISSKVDAVFNANLTATDGDIAIDQTSTDGVVTLSGNLTSSNGMIDIAAVGSIVQTAGTLTTSTSGRQIQLRSAQGSFEQRNGSRVIATNGVITVVANQWIDIAHLQAGTGEITLNAETGGIYDAGDTDVDIQSETLVFKAAEGFGTNENDIDTDIERINGSTGAGAINIQENDSLEVMAEGLSVLTSGNILMNNLNGNLTANGRISIKDTGNIRLKADNGSIETYADIQTAGANAITLQARNNITQHAYTTISTGEGGSVDAIAELGGVEQHDGALITTGNTGSIRLQAQGAIKVAGLHVAQGDVSLISVAGAITDSGDQNIDVLADQLRMSAGVGAGARDDALDISVDVLAARAGSGGIHLNEANTIHIDTLTDITVLRVQADGSLATVTDAGISDLATSDNGDISLTSQDGDILVFNGSEHEDNAGIVANGSGDISLIASKGNITITENTDVISERGNVTLLAERNVLQEAGAGIIVSDSANGKQVRIEAVTGSVRQQDTSFIETVDSNIKVRAGQHIDVASIRTGEATVTMEAISGGIYDAGDSDLDIVAENLEFTANDAFGVNNDDIDTQIANVFGHVASGTINLQEEDSLNIHNSGLSIANDGDILVHSKSGDINVTGDMRVDNVGHIRIKADQGNIVIDANVTTASDSSISIQSLQNIHQLANSTISTTAGGTIDLWSEGASILQQDSAIITTGETGSVRLLAGDSMALAAVHVGTGNVSLMTEAGSIVDSGDSHKDIVARELRVDASVGMGAGNAIDTSVDVYAGRAGSGGLHIDEDSDITVSTLDDISIQRVKSDGSTETVMDKAISDLRTSDNGSISLKTIDGTITVYDGNVPDDGVGIYAHGSGSVHLDAYGSGQDVRIKEDTDVVSDQGNIHILAEDAVLQEAGADIAVGTGGNIAVRALNGSIYMTDGTSASTKGAGNILYHAKVDVDLSRLSGEAHTTVIADSGQIRDNLEIGADRINYDAKIDPDLETSRSACFLVRPLISARPAYP
ncbi:beta strand repeat-containing protein [Endozoicomonas atrinae]|uniref:beta strand repeat-containing protein n=1 Tax=Endozoicomonas atrinae TaxID=1333660 RepID=UPI0008262863|nr:hypothetical protein [Endozoicomonas atrinae]